MVDDIDSILCRPVARQIDLTLKRHIDSVIVDPSASTEGLYRIVAGIIAHYTSQGITVRDVDARSDATAAKVEEGD
jgi:hypothetical protein